LRALRKTLANRILELRQSGLLAMCKGGFRTGTIQTGA
jgi:hypothetical protein